MSTPKSSTLNVSNRFGFQNYLKLDEKHLITNEHTHPVEIGRVTPRRPKLGIEHPVEPCPGLRIGQPVTKEPLGLETKSFYKTGQGQVKYSQNKSLVFERRRSIGKLHNLGKSYNINSWEAKRIATLYRLGKVHKNL